MSKIVIDILRTMKHLWPRIGNYLCGFLFFLTFFPNIHSKERMAREEKEILYINI